ncbi:MAG: C-terminal binding protein [Chloroflexi bacterium]|nr:C-terminal binding protein [Chloroflexota bacterium]
MADLKLKALTTDYTWPSVEPERKVLAAAGIELVAAPASDEATLARMAQDVDAILFCFAKVTPAVLRAARRCVVASRYGIGVDNIDRATCNERGIVVTNVPDYCMDEVTDHVMAMILAYNRDLNRLDSAVRQGGWGKTPLPAHSRRLRNTTIGIVGLGRIGRALVPKVSAFGMSILAHDPYVKPEAAPSGVRMTTLEDLLKNSDFVTVHSPLTEQTRGLIGRPQLRLMKRTAFLVNAARGPLVDEQALVEALQAETIGGAGLDVLETEPPRTGSPLLKLPNLIVTPHTAFYSQESLLELETRTAREVVRVLNGQRPENWINPEIAGRTRAKLP